MSFGLDDRSDRGVADFFDTNESHEVAVKRSSGGRGHASCRDQIWLLAIFVLTSVASTRSFPMIV